MDPKQYRIGKVFLSATTPNDAEEFIVSATKTGVTNYICVSNMRTVVYANEHEDYCKLMNEALMCTPDGTPLVWMARLWGRKDVMRTMGPELFVSILEKPELNLRHFLLGDTEETLASMRNKYPNAGIVGTYSPPFKPLEEYDLQGIANEINQSEANLVWISLRAPKQDYLAQQLKPLLTGKICIGVGAGFRYALGEYKQPSIMVQKMGLTGFFWRRIGLQGILTYIKWAMLCIWWGIDILVSRFLKCDN